MSRSVPQLVILVFGLAFPASASGQTITNLSWTTRFAAAPPKLDQSTLLGVRAAIRLLGETNLISASSVGAQLLGLNGAESRKLQSLLQARYAEIAKDPVFLSARSQLGYCFSEQRPPTGSAAVYLPAKIDHDLHPIVFLHGYGGSFTWYLHAMARTFPDRVVIAPAFGIQPDNINRRYVREAMAAVSRSNPQLGALRKPVLIGLSAGGRGACHVYSKHPDDFAALICLAAPPPRSTWRRFDKRHRSHFICGQEEAFVKNGSMTQAITALRRNSSVGLTLMEAGDHFFLLEFAAATERALAQALSGVLAAAEDSTGRIRISPPKS